MNTLTGGYISKLSKVHVADPSITWDCPYMYIYQLPEGGNSKLPEGGHYRLPERGHYKLPEVFINATTKYLR